MWLRQIQRHPDPNLLISWRLFKTFEILPDPLPWTGPAPTTATTRRPRSTTTNPFPLPTSSAASTATTAAASAAVAPPSTPQSPSAALRTSWGTGSCYSNSCRERGSSSSKSSWKMRARRRPWARARGRWRRRRRRGSWRTAGPSRRGTSSTSRDTSGKDIIRIDDNYQDNLWFLASVEIPKPLLVKNSHICYQNSEHIHKIQMCIFNVE